MYHLESDFLIAWKKAVEYAGIELFTNHKDYPAAPTINEATEKRQLIPNYDAIIKYMDYASLGEKLFISVMYSFYNGYQGAIFCKELGYSGFGDIAYRLSAEEREIVSDLMRHHLGW